MKRLIVISLFVIALLSVSVYRAKEGAQESEAKIAQLEKEIAAEKEDLRVLKAEEAHLSRPERIGQLASEKLGMGPVRPEQMSGEVAFDTKSVDDLAKEAAQ